MRPVVWQEVGAPGVSHLFPVTFYRPPSPTKPEPVPTTPLCGGEKESALVYRAEGIFCRWCISMEGGIV